MPSSTTSRTRRLTRRRFLRGVGALAAVTMTGAALSCGPISKDDEFGGILGKPIPEPEQYPEVPWTPTVRPDRSILRSFTLDQARTVDALTARIIPGTQDDPGAREAEVVVYIDNMLSFNNGSVERFYGQPPYAKTYQGDTPPEQESGPYQYVWVASDQIDRYGPQGVLSPVAVYQSGIAALNTFADNEYGEMFADLSEDEQDEIVTMMADGDDISTFTEPSASDFFETVRQHTIQGYFGDPAYGGNQDYAGWRLIGYPGAQRGYTPEEMHTDGSGLLHQTQGIIEMHQFHPGEPHDNVIRPVSGSDDDEVRSLLLEQICGPSTLQGVNVEDARES
ncbi:MAG: gluconate 2-dehydrogenase subunit 3 family protein [Thermomicrobiales bacterium]